MKNLFKLFLLISIINLNFACEESKVNQTDKELKDETVNHIAVKYAKGFSIDEYKNYKVLNIYNAWKGENSTYQYVLYKEKKPKGFSDATFIKIPIKSIACMSLTHLAFIDRLNKNNTITAISGCDYVSNQQIRAKIDNQQIKEIGQEQQINYEMLIDHKPDVLMAYGINESSKKNLAKLKQLGITVVLNAEYMENHPLGQAEWIKFVAAFYDLEEEANEIFFKIEDEYEELKDLVSKIENKPSVFVGMPWNGMWYLAGGESFQAQLLNDAGANYLWADNEDKSNFTVDKEVIIEKAIDADYWINLNTYSTIKEVVDYDNNFLKFNAIKKRYLYNNNKRTNKNGGNDFWESGVVNPHLILKDLITIFHPDIIEHELYYYKKLD